MLHTNNGKEFVNQILTNWLEKKCQANTQIEQHIF